MSRDLSNLRQEIKELIIESLGLDDVTPEEIEDDGPLFGDGLGLDSIDALELAVALEKRFNVKVPPDQDTKKLFYSVATLAELIRSRLAP